MSADATVRFHVSLNVADLSKAVAFYRTLFGREPAKLRADYAKFETDEPPLVLSLEPTPQGGGGPLNHLGIRLPDPQALLAVQVRLEAAGLRCQREEGVECCYAKQTKFWAHDPDGTLWEIYTLDEDIDHRGAGQSESVVRPSAEAPPAAVVWEHRLTDPVPDRVPLADESASEVRFRGTFNLPISADDRRRLLAEALRVLQPGGRVFVHVLTGERPVDAPALPGPAGGVRYVPPEGDVVEWIESSGFTGVRLTKFTAKPCFVRNGVEMREMQLEGWKPVAEEPGRVEVMYRGPFRHIVDDRGQNYPRGVRVAVSATTARQLCEGTAADNFVTFAAKSKSLELTCS